MSRLPTTDEVAIVERVLADRRASRSTADRWSSLARLGGVWTLGVLFLIGLVAQQSVPIDDLLLDQSQVNGGRWYDGMVTSLGVLAWTVSACACAAAGFASHIAGRRAAHRTLATGAAIVTVLLLDDLFLLHSNVFPRLLGGSKLTYVGLEAVAIALWAIGGVAELRRTRWELLFAAGASFALSVGTDIVNLFGLDPVSHLVLEDGAKFLGLLALALWATSTAADVIRSIARPAAAH